MSAPILLLHGILDGPHAWDHVARELRAAGREVVVHDARDLITPHEVASAVADLLPAHVVGHSRGATAASWLAVEHGALVRSLGIVASPPHASEAFRAAFARRRAADASEARAIEYLAKIPEDDFPGPALRRYRGPALVVEYEDDPLYSPTHTMFWRMFLPYAAFHRVPGGHRAFATDAEAGRWLAQQILLLTRELDG